VTLPLHRKDVVFASFNQSYLVSLLFSIENSVVLFLAGDNQSFVGKVTFIFCRIFCKTVALIGYKSPIKVFYIRSIRCFVPNRTVFC